MRNFDRFSSVQGLTSDRTSKARSGSVMTLLEANRQTSSWSILHCNRKLRDSTVCQVGGLVALRSWDAHVMRNKPSRHTSLGIGG